MQPAESLIALLDSNTAQLQQYLEGLSDAEMLEALPGAGGQHALWLATHVLACEDGAINGWVLGQPPRCLGDDVMAVIRPGQAPDADGAHYPTRDELLACLPTIRENTRQALLNTPLEQWTRPTNDAPEIFPTVSAVFYRMPLHAAFHTGQIASIRRMLGHKPVMI